MGLLLAGDIGGTKTSLSLADARDPEHSLWHCRYPSQNYPSLTPIVQEFLAQAQRELGRDPQPVAACFAVAGPVVEQRAKVTNLPWDLQASQLEVDLGIPHVALINDFSAVGYGVLTLKDKDLDTLQAGKRQPQAPIGVIGAGTGLGQAYLTWGEGGYQVHPSEGGHVDFAPRTPLEWELLRYLQQRYGRISTERVVSGQGIVAIYQFLRDSGWGQGEAQLLAQIQAWEKGAEHIDPAAQIANAAMEARDPLAVECLRLFISLYGATVGNFALQLLPRGGLFIAGGIAPKLLRLLHQGEFLPSFLDKGRMRPLLEQLSVQVVVNAQVGLMGAAAYASTL
ncbi:glucokinase [Thermostichus vulcanus]|uniref:Glucokinase n=1 Tax=Thermostichus vulcanus str. 'Rupite' TaxID=2813851 RepID=A0ABT0CBE5_THEVL|nr:glucokinase [Thermostichus vulcanus]MCJ2542680.1 glucokinase [Thermostichus vulcanus str. 'Rupite']